MEKYQIIDGIKVFHQDISENNEDYNAEGLDLLFRFESRHFWFVARREYIVKQFLKYISKNNKIIEIGAGTGSVARELMKNGYRNFAVGEMHMNGLRYARNYGIEECFQFDILRAPFEREFDVVCMFDVLEHIPDEKTALENVNKMLKSDGRIVLTLPAHMWLWSAVDEISGHKRRYNRKDLNALLENSGFEVETTRYFFTSIIPLLFMRTIMNKRNDSDKKPESGAEIDGLLNSLLLMTTRAEIKLSGLIPNIFGGSLFAVAKKI